MAKVTWPEKYTTAVCNCKHKNDVLAASSGCKCSPFSFQKGQQDMPGEELLQGGK
jgi:hypothetical protein